MCGHCTQAALMLQISNASQYGNDNDNNVRNGNSSTCCHTCSLVVILIVADPVSSSDSNYEIVWDAKALAQTVFMRHILLLHLEIISPLSYTFQVQQKELSH